MAITSQRVTQYYIEYDMCGTSDTVADNWTEDVHSKQQAIKWAGMHKVKDDRILCPVCFEVYKEARKSEKDCYCRLCTH